MGGAAAAVLVVGAVFAVPAIGDAVGTLLGVDGQLDSLAIVGITLLAVTVTGDYGAAKLLVVVWGAFITSAAFTQMRCQLLPYRLGRCAERVRAQGRARLRCDDVDY